MTFCPKHRAPREYSGPIVLLSLFVVLQSPAQIPLRTKLGQMIMVTATGDSLEEHSPSMDTLKSDLDQGLVGGLAMFTWSGNLKSPAQIAHFTEELQKRANTPLLLAIDEEGGQVARLGRSNGFAQTPSAGAMGYVKNEQYTRSTAATMAGWFVQTGLTMNLAPVVDVNVNPSSPAIGALERSFSARPDSVALQAGWFIDEFHKRRIVTTLKHFPGHGSATGDSHLGLTDVTRTWTAAELDPYTILMGQQVVDAVMTAHVFNATLDSVYPATLSRKTITGLLREQMGYQGVVVSDEMGMKAITSQFGQDQAVELAVNAGVDILVYSRNLDSTGGSLARHVVDYLEGCVQRGTVTVARVDEAYQRITTLKGRYLTAAPLTSGSVLPAEFGMSSFPNPFNSTATIICRLSRPARVVQEILDILGRPVATLFDAESAAGELRTVWSGRDARGADASSGVYFCRTRIVENQAPIRVGVLRMLLLR
jgi:beta-N-acetylhexosaminidase